MLGEARNFVSMVHSVGYIWIKVTSVSAVRGPHLPISLFHLTVRTTVTAEWTILG
jgi:hypothetical protein